MKHILQNIKDRSNYSKKYSQMGEFWMKALGHLQIIYNYLSKTCEEFAFPKNLFNAPLTSLFLRP